MKTKSAILLAAFAAFSASASVIDAVDVIVESAAPTHYLIVGDGALGSAITRRAAEIAPNLVVLPLRAPDLTSCELFRSAVASEENLPPRVAAAAELGPIPFLLAWLSDAPDAAIKAVALADAPAAPSLASGFDSMPSGAVWKPIRAGTAAAKRDAQALEGALDSVGEALAFPASDDGGALEGAIRSYFSRLANDLGRRLALAGATAAAREAFVSASSLYPDSPSAILNLASLERASKNADAEARNRLAGLLQNLRPTSGILAADCGVLIKAQDFFDAGWYWTISGIPATDTEAAKSAFAALPSTAPIDQLRNLLTITFTIQRGAVEPIVNFFFSNLTSSDSTLTPELRIAAARVLADTVGDLVRATALVARFATPGTEGIPPDTKVSADKPFWAAAAGIAADCLARRGDITGLNALTSKLLTTINGNAEYEALVALAVGPANVELSRWDVAAEAFSRAGEAAEPFAKAASALSDRSPATARSALSEILADPNAPWYAHRMALDASIGLIDPDGAVKEAMAILETRPRDAYAHWALGSVAAQRGDKAGALNHLQTSVALKPTFVSLNDLASVLVETGNPAQAEKFARMAVDVAGDEVPALRETLGEALEASGKTREAAIEYARAVAIAEKSGQEPAPRLRLHLAETLLATGDAAGAAALLPLIDKTKDALSVDERTRLGSLRKALSAAAQK